MEVTESTTINSRSYMKAGFDVGWLLCIIIRGMLIMMAAAAVVMEATEAIEAVG